MLYLPISSRWMVSIRAQRTYSACALSSAMLLAIVFGTNLALSVSGLRSSAIPLGTALLLRALLWPCMRGCAVLTIAMWYFWFSFDDSVWLKKAAWFVLLYMFIMIGPVLCYLFVYRRSPILEKALD